MIYNLLQKELASAANPEYALVAQRFFKTGCGEYGEGDIFIGVRVPVLRSIVKPFIPDSTLEDVKELIKSKIHEERLCAGIILVGSYTAKNCTEQNKKKIYDFYMANAGRFNNWDLVDLTAPYISGDYLLSHSKKVLYDFARSKNIWKRRISIITTLGFIRSGERSCSYELADILIYDQHDLMHKAVGWTLREAGKRDKKELELFLKSRYKTMPRTMLRYAIEKFPENVRKKYLAGNI